jgi:hypothetical protein
VDFPPDSNGLRRSIYRIWPNREYAQFSDPGNLLKFHETLGEVARISAESTVEMEFAALGVDTADIVARAGGSVDSQSPQHQQQQQQQNTSTSGASQLGGGGAASARSRKWMVIAGDGEFPMEALDVTQCLTAEQLEDLMAMKPESEDEDFIV